MESLISIFDREVPIQQHKIDSLTASFPTSLHSTKALALDSALNYAKLAKMKANLREAEEELIKVLAAKTRKEASQMEMRDSISAAKATVQELKRNVQVQRDRRDEYGAIISQQSIASSKTEEAKHEIRENGEIQQAISWYNQILGLQIEVGHGVKFKFNNINIKNLKQQYSFTICHVNDAYSLLDCDPSLNGIKELINELNRKSGLFKFVRIMREKFQEAAALGLQPQSTSFLQDSSTVSVSGPALLVSNDKSRSSAKKNDHRSPLKEVNRQFKKANHRSKSPAKLNESQLYDGEFNLHPKKVAKSDILSPPVRRSPRLKAKK